MSERHSVILASAGSGKTFELAGRYIRLLDSGAAPERILALTFTRKAAGEMLARVVKRLLDATKESNALEQIGGLLGRPVSTEDARSLALSLVRRIGWARVQTLDAFLTQSVRAVAPDLGLPPKWRVMDEAEQDAIAEVALDRLFERVPLDELTTTVERMLGEMPLKPYEAVLRAVRLMLTGWQECPDLERWGVRPQKVATVDQARAVQANLVGLPHPRTAKGPVAESMVKALRKVCEQVDRREWRGLLDNTLIKNASGSGSYYNVAIPEAHRNLLIELQSLASSHAIAELCEQSKAAGTIAASFDRALRDAKRERGVIAFDDLARLLLEGGAAADPEWLAFRLDSAIDHVLLDEFQDTSLRQYLCLEPILREIASQDDHRSIFAVGDVKQSLYGWRAAVPDLLPSLPARLHLAPASTRAKNWRSSPAILDAVNAVFREIGNNKCLGEYRAAAERWAKFFETHRAAKSDISGEVRIERSKSEHDEESNPASTAPSHLDQTAARVAEIHAEHPEWSVAVLLRTTSNNSLSRHVEALKRRGIEAAEDRGFPLTAEPAINGVLSLLQLAEHPGDSAAGYHVSLSALGALVGLRDPLDRTSRARCSDASRAEIAASGLVAFLRRLRIGLAPALSESAVSRWIEMERLASAFDSNPGGSLSEFIRTIEKSSVVDPSRARVSVMTIHRSKGLEFDAVVLPDLNRSWFKVQPRLLVDRGEDGESDPLAPVRRVTQYPSAELQNADPELAAMAKRYRSRVVREELSCLYVAMTRAIRRLDVLLEASAKIASTPSSAGVLLATEWPREPVPAEGRIAHFLHRGVPQKPPATQNGTFSTAASTAPLVDMKLGAHASATKTTPSSKAKADLAESLTFEVARAAQLLAGEVWHYALETIEWRDAGAASRAAQLAARKFRLTELEHRDLSSKLSICLDTPMGELFDARRYAERPGTARVLREWPFATSIAHNLPEMSGRIDRLVVGVDGSLARWAEIVDYKVQVGSDAEAAEAHRPQLDLYRLAVATLLKIPLDQVSCVVAFPLAGAAVVLPPSNQSSLSADKRAGRNPKKT